MLRRACLLLLATLPSVVAHAAPAAASPPVKPTLAILLFDYSGKDASLEPLREGLAQMLIADAASAPGLHVVERARLKEVLEEQKLGASGKVDPSSAARVGKLLGARWLVLGSYFDLAGQLRVDARVVEVETGKILGAAAARGPTNDFWTIEQDLARKLGDLLANDLPKLPPPAAQPARPPKLKAGTVATYGRALASLDRGRKDDAKALLATVVAEAPDFALAKSDLNALLR